MWTDGGISVSTPTTKTLFTTNKRVVGIQMLCPDREVDKKYIALRCETARDYSVRSAPELAGHPSPLGFLLRCDRCGYRVEMTGSRLSSAAMLGSQWRGNPNA